MHSQNMVAILIVMWKRRNEIVYAGMESYHNTIVGVGMNDLECSRNGAMLVMDWRL